MDRFIDEKVLIEAPLGAVPAMLEARDRWLRGEPAQADDAEASNAGAIVGGKWWTERQLHRLREQTHYPSVRALLELCAARAGEWVPKAEADSAAGVSARQLASELGAWSKLIRREFNRDDWPIEWRKVADKFAYRMSSEVAELW